MIENPEREYEVELAVMAAIQVPYVPELEIDIQIEYACGETGLLDVRFPTLDRLQDTQVKLAAPFVKTSSATCVTRRSLTSSPVACADIV